MLPEGLNNGARSDLDDLRGMPDAGMILARATNSLGACPFLRDDAAFFADFMDPSIAAGLISSS